MSQNSAGPEILRLIELISRLPGLGPRSARRVALFLLKRRDTLLKPLADALAEAGEKIERCKVCGNFDTVQPCAVCQAGGRDDALVCVVEDVPDLWALERGGAFRGRYHVLGGVLSAIDGITPDDLNIPSLVTRVDAGGIREVILALNATVDGQTTAHYVAELLEGKGVSVTRLAHGVPVGGELDHLDDGTLAAALRSRRDI
ncbi:MULTISPECIES: recombination mediator RecR [unclassified Hyphomonas]|jgi:recombination protein RecR|uniref:recombination mediator RecR n=1 Tax=unclassified Hyphomonas TaxID=2630699 RepID=UPI000C499D26|nr:MULTISPECIES: recombination mediator RecR [unclassified Hyphomonas]MAN92022.1 recombination protein RecR [Hyphomonadaceae bacterium]HAQ36595.1 recombination protein RecR [Alphaproteobacteria bacterium]MAL45160.1 recombination protein RecR [Hyphomonas sp.]MAX83620.1 recombination protein RecR [Hyphomonas sp.]MDF1807663.1 recombination mediator RecR [Hyphomonas sp.]|tara:strand:- start:4093 stop:4698 length:606 start_codon:yes stop_codon:yes gene_type:complete